MTPEIIARAIDHAAACQRRVAMIKRGESFEYIGEVPLPGAHFSNARLENDYQLRHPMISTLHPGPLAGTAIGAAVAAYFKGNRMIGATVGGTAGLLGEGMHRLGYLLGARRKLRAGVNPLDKRYRL